MVTIYPVVHNLECNGRARAHAVMYANKTSPMTSAQATAAFNGIIKDYEPSQDIADHGETVGTQGTVWSSVVMFKEPSGYVRSSYPTFPHPMPAGGMLFNDPTFMAEVTTTAIQHLQMYGLSGLKSPAGGPEPSHDVHHLFRSNSNLGTCGVCQRIPGSGLLRRGSTRSGATERPCRVQSS